MNVFHLFHLNIFTLVKSMGYLGLFAVIFFESGVFFGFFLPGGSLLFTAGVLASSGIFNVYFLIVILAIAAIFGDNVGYWFGFKVGPKIFNKEDSLFFHKKHVDQTHDFYERNGSMAIIIGRFIPIVRTFVPILAGVGKMNYHSFLRYNIVGGIIWSAGMTLLGYFLGTTIPGAERFILPFILVIVVLSILPIVVSAFSKSKKSL